MKADGVADLVTVAEVAERRGVHRDTARRWLLALEAKHGGVVWRIGDGPRAKLVTTTTALAKVAPELVEATRDMGLLMARIEKDIDTLTNRTTQLLSRVRELAARLSTLERRSAILRIPA